MKKKSLLTPTPKLIMTVTLIVMIGGLFGAVVYLATKLKIDSPIEKSVVVITDKTEYEQEEMVKIIVRNNLDNSIWYRDDVYCYLEFNSGNAWAPSLIINMMVCPRGEIKELDSNREISYYIDFSNNNHIFYSGAGKYRISFKYNHSLENVSGKTLYSNEFTIKEKMKKDISNWQTYQNKEYGFEVKYPQDWEKIDKTPAIMSFVYKGNEKNIIQIRSNDRKNDTSLIEQIKGKESVEPELVKINNKDFYSLKISMAGLMFYEYYIENKNKIFIISMVNVFADLSKNAQDESDIKYPTDEELSEELNILRTMVSTFKFIEK